VDTGIYTGRSPKDKYFVEEDMSKKHLWWGEVNQKIEADIFDELFNKVKDYYNTDTNKTYIFDGFGGADKSHQLPIRIIAKKAWQAHFSNNMFIRPSKGELENFIPEFTIINASDVSNDEFEAHGMNSETFIVFNLKKKVAIIGGTEYGGEMKKGIFSVLHYLLPLKNILSMHCSANVDMKNENACLFFGLSGTGKTTLSTDPNRMLIGDDEHGWSDNGIFNFEGGCYAKVIRLNKKDEPDIHNAIRHGALLENVVYDLDTNEIDFNDGSKTENTRVSYPLNHIDNSLYGKGYDSISGHPKNIIFLTCDAFGVLPPIAKLSTEQAMYHFISGYTAKVAGTERGITEPIATFSPCFGGPFLTLHPLKYAELLKEKIKTYGSKVFLVNTGWVGGSPSSGAKRISIGDTRKIIDSILLGSINEVSFNKDEIFGLMIPSSLDGVKSEILNPINAWSDKGLFINESKKLSDLFKKNFKKYGTEVEYLVSGGPL
ncbi:MAG: phosphoenolpyruvate carboxykinase (ATP), partial [Candidatus Marinimicrobia bacterium]|nr:phosphoenolpyruvate carboxykinase (ATP) [Candidatus Neomarinimicrobiota bacterium]